MKRPEIPRCKIGRVRAIEINGGGPVMDTTATHLEKFISVEGMFCAMDKSPNTNAKPKDESGRA